MSQLIPEALDYYLDYEGTENLQRTWNAFGNLNDPLQNRYHAIRNPRTGQAQMQPTLGLIRPGIFDGASTNDVQPTGWNLPDSYEQSGIQRQLNQPSSLTGNLVQNTTSASYSSSMYCANGPAQVPLSVAPIFHPQPIATPSNNNTKLSDNVSSPPTLLPQDNTISDSASIQGVFQQVQNTYQKAMGAYNTGKNIYNAGKNIYNSAKDAYESFSNMSESSSMTGATSETASSASELASAGTEVAEVSEWADVLADVELGAEIAAIFV